MNRITQFSNNISLDTYQTLVVSNHFFYDRKGTSVDWEMPELQHYLKDFHRRKLNPDVAVVWLMSHATKPSRN